MRLQDEREHPHGLPDREFDALFTTDKPVIFAFHGYPWLIHRLTYRRHNHANIHVRGYKEEGTTTTPFDMVMRNDLDRFHLVIDVIDRVPGLSVTHAAPAPAHARRAAAVQAPRLHPRAGRAGRGRVGVAGVGLDTGNTPNRSVQHRGEGPYSPSRPRCIVDPTEGDGQDMIEITEDASSRRSFVQAEVRNDHLDDAVTWASGPAR